MRPDRPPRPIRLVEDRWTTIRHVVEAVAIVGAGVWAFYTFFYQEKIKPAGEPPALTPTVSIRRLGRDATKDIVSVTIGFRNEGKTEIDIAADALNVWGVRYGAQERTVVQDTAAARDYRAALPIASRQLIMALAELRDAAMGGMRGKHYVIEPGATITNGELIALRRGQYDVIRAQVIAVPVKTSTLGWSSDGFASRRVRVDVVPQRGGGNLLRPDPTRAFEDDNTADFALIP